MKKTHFEEYLSAKLSLAAKEPSLSFETVAASYESNPPSYSAGRFKVKWLAFLGAIAAIAICVPVLLVNLVRSPAEDSGSSYTEGPMPARPPMDLGSYRLEVSGNPSILGIIDRTELYLTVSKEAGEFSSLVQGQNGTFYVSFSDPIKKLKLMDAVEKSNTVNSSFSFNEVTGQCSLYRDSAREDWAFLVIKG